MKRVDAVGVEQAWKAFVEARRRYILDEELPKFLASTPRPRLAIYNAGTDILAGDPVGRMAVSAEHVAARDRLVVRTLAERGISTVVVTSGGYTRESHRLIAQLAIDIVETCDAIT